MKRIIGVATIAVLFGVTAANAQNRVGTDGARGAGNAVGEKEAYPAKDPARTGNNGGSQTIPGRRGAGASVGEKESYPSNDPARSGTSGSPTNPRGAGTVGETRTGQ